MEEVKNDQRNNIIIMVLALLIASGTITGEFLYRDLSKQMDTLSASLQLGFRGDSK